MMESLLAPATTRRGRRMPPTSARTRNRTRTANGLGKESPETLKGLGLTRRESEVLFWLMEGKANAEIGIILGCRTNTVRKHMEHILAKLGVESRAAAMRRAMDFVMG